MCNSGLVSKIVTILLLIPAVFEFCCLDKLFGLDLSSGVLLQFLILDGCMFGGMAP